MTVELFLSALSIIGMIILGFLQWRTASKRAKSGEALDWSTAANNLRREIDAQSVEIVNLRNDMRNITNMYKALQELTRRFIKELAKRGDPIILSEDERLLLETNPRFKTAKKDL